MKANQVKSTADLLKLVRARDLKHVKVGAFDMDGILRGKYMAREKFESALKGGYGFCDVVLGWDSKDQLYDNVKYTGWHTGYPDCSARLLPDTVRELPLEDNMVFVLSEFSGEAEKICPRGVLRRTIDKARSMGLEPFGSCEYEFFVFNETPDSVREKNYRNLDSIAPDFFGYSVLRTTTHSELYQGLLDLCEEMEFPLEGLHEETGPGVMEGALKYTSLLEAGDRAALFKTFTKIFAQKQGKMATFMAKWSPDWPGQSGHIHLSLKSKSGKAVFYDAKKLHNMSDTMRWFLGGQQKLMPEFLAMVSPTVNSYTRLIPGFWAPTDSTWGVENRTCALRVIPGSSKSQRIEYRVAAADNNPYLGLAAALASGLWGIENKVEPQTEAVKGNAYDVTWPAKLNLPRTLWDAAQKFRKSKPAREMFGDDFVDHYAATREWEEREFRRHISDWEMNRYFEII